MKVTNWSFWKFLGLAFAISCIETVISKPRIVGDKDVKVYLGHDVFIDCFGDREVNWYKLINDTKETSLIDEEAHITHINLETPDYVDWPDLPHNSNETFLAVLNLIEIKEKESGTYVCVYENDGIAKIKQKIAKNKVKFFSLIQLSVVAVKPTIDNGKRIVVDSGQNVNMTCRGEKPVTWIFLTNHTSGVQHTETIINNVHISVLELQNVNYTDVGYFICSFSGGSQSFYEDFDHKSDPNTTSTYLFVRDTDHLLTLRGVHSISSPINSEFTIPCKPTFPEVTVELVKMESASVHGNYIYFTHNAQDGATVVNHKSSNETIFCRASYLGRREQVEFIVEKDPFKSNEQAMNTYFVNAHTYENNQKFVFDDQNGFRVDSASLAQEGIWNCLGTYGNISDNVMIVVNRIIYHSVLPNTNVSVGAAWQINPMKQDIHTYDVREREVVEINCTAFYISNMEKIMWTVPDNENTISTHNLRDLFRGDKIQQNRLITDASFGDSGTYSCYVTNGHVNSSAYEFALNVFPSDSSHLELKAQKWNISHETKDTLDTLVWIIYFRAYPDMTLTWYFNGEKKVRFASVRNAAVGDFKPIVQTKEQYEIKINWAEGEITLKIHSPTIRNVGEYSLVAENKNLKKIIPLQFVMEGPPEAVVTSLSPTEKTIPKKESQFFIVCSAYGFPLPKLSIFFTPCAAYGKCSNNDNTSNVQILSHNNEKLNMSTDPTIVTGLSKSIWEAVANEQGKYVCAAQNKHGTMYSNASLLTITDSELEQKDYLHIELEINGVLSIPSSDVKLIEGDTVALICRGNNLRTVFPLGWNAEWKTRRWTLFGSKSFSFQGMEISLLEKQTKYSFVSKINTTTIKDMDKLKLSCSDSSDKSKERTVYLNVTEAIHPFWTSKPLKSEHYTMNENKPLSWTCSGWGVPFPEVSWYKNDEKILPDENDKRISILDGNITFAYVFPTDSGKYMCQIKNRVGFLEDYISLEVVDPDASSNLSLYISIGIIAFLFSLVIIYLIIRICREKRRNEALRLLKEKVFVEGNPDSLNPDIDLADQADLLPYDHRFEFPKENLIFDKLIGSGAFGNVFKAVALDLNAGELRTTVAVKMMKSCTDEGQMKALRSELKIMIHIGRHINIVNILGACCKNMISKGELLLIVEYCRHGNILEYMRRHRAAFVDQINLYGKVDGAIRKSIRSRIGSSRASFRPTYAQLDMQRNSMSDSWERPRQRLSYVENSCQSVGSALFDRRRIQSDGAASVEDEMVSTDMTVATVVNSDDNYVSESTLEQLGPFCTKTLLHWGYQIANGMFYLSERKVIHGDLAARNILLGDRNVVKISDFGLSKNIYKQENYKKKSKGLLPIKWVALEALRDNIFSTQSDVWSYGIVLWEIFTLGQNPYPGVEVDENFIQKLEDGFRLKQPQYATLELFELMESCWHSEPNMRPSFRNIEIKFGDMLGATDKEMYLTLNAPYEENNSYSEHLKRIRTPTYDSRVQGFFTEEDFHSLGYEVPLRTNSPGIFMPEEDEASAVVPRLHPAPYGRKSTLTIGLPGTQMERESLINSTDENYLVMHTPSVVNQKQQHFTFEEIPLQDNSNKLYQNLPHLTERNTTTFEAKRQESEGSDSAPKNDEDPEGDSEENDSVFSPSPKEGQIELQQQQQQSSVELAPIALPSNGRNLRLSSAPKSNGKFELSNIPWEKSCRHKHDSGVHFPSVMQNNPLYWETIGTNPLPIKINADTTRSTTIDINYNPSKQRTQSESSSGFGSLSEDKCNSLEKNREIVLQSMC